MFRLGVKQVNAQALNLLRKQAVQNSTKQLNFNNANGRNISSGVRRLVSPNVADGTGGSHKPTPFQQKILVMTKTYPSIEKIPERITRAKMAHAMDKFRVKMCIWMTVGTIIISAIVAVISRRVLTGKRRILVQEQRDLQRQQQESQGQ